MNRRILGIILITLLLITNITQYAFAATVLKEGSRGTEVVKLQQRLIDLGYLKGKADGIFGAGTKAALAAFQKANNLTADGIAGTQTYNVLYSSNAKPAGTSSSGGNTPPPPASDNTSIQRVLRKGDRGSDVAALQNRLNELKYNAGTPDGIFGSGTQNAVIAFQRDNGLGADGIVGSKTIASLFSDVHSTPTQPSQPPANNDSGSNTMPITSVLKKGSRGDQVVTLQKRLNELGFNCGTADGAFGTATYNAVVAFQKSKNLTADGIVGSATVSKLFSTQSGSGGSPAPAPTPVPVPNPDPDITLPGADALKGKIVIIDPGHGGVDSGASHGGFYEKNLALDMGLRLKKLLEQAGATVLMTRSDDRYLSLYYRSAFANKTILDLEIKDVTKKKDSAYNSLLEKQNAAIAFGQDSFNLELYSSALNQLKLYKDSYELQANTSAQMAVNMLYTLESTLQPVKYNLQLLGISSESKGLVELAASVESYSGNLLTERAELQANLKTLSTMFGGGSTIASLETKAQELNSTLSVLVQTLDYAEALRNSLGQYTRQLIYKGTSSLKDVLDELDTMIGSIYELNIPEQIIKLENDILELHVNLQRYNDTLADLTRKLNAFNVYLSNPSLNSRTGIYQAVNSGALNLASKDLTEVMDLTREKYQDNMVFIAIHLNATEQTVTTASGMRVFFRDNVPDSWNNVDYYKNYNTSARNKLATKLLHEMNNTTNFSKKPNIPDRADFSVLRENNLVSALIEVGFMNNPDDLQKVSQPAFRENAAIGMLKGIVEYFK